MFPPAFNSFKAETISADTGIPHLHIARAVRSGSIRKQHISTAPKDAWLSSQQAHLTPSQPLRVISAVQNSIAAVRDSALTVIHFSSSLP